MKSKLLFSSLLGLAGLLFTGCEVSVANLTPSKVPQNPSNTYTLSMSTRVHDGDVMNKSITPYIVIDGKVHQMHQSDISRLTFDYDYTPPANQSEAKYYYVLTYQIDVHGKPRDREFTTEVFDFAVINRYVLSMESNRGPAGSRISIMGRGFKPTDKVLVGGYEAPTTFGSSHTLTFTVPPLNATRNYPVEVKSGDDTLHVGEFRVDAADLHVNQSRIQLPSGDRTILIVKVDVDAPEGGIPLNITTDIPDSLVMPEVSISAGTRSVSIPVEGSTPGEGSLYIEAPGFGEVTIPTYVVGSTEVDIQETVVM